MAVDALQIQVKQLLAKVAELETKAAETPSATGDSFSRITPRIDTFSGTSTEDANIWLERLEQVAKFHKWEPEKSVTAVQLYLRGPAEAWAKTLDCAVLKDFKKFKDAFLAKFIHKAAKFLLDTRFHERRMEKADTVEAFLLDLQDLARKLGKSDKDVLGQFLRGLKPSIKTLVMTQSPTTVADAAQLAMVAESVQKEEKQQALTEIQSTVETLCKGMDNLTTKLDTMQKNQQDQARHEHQLGPGLPW